MGAPERRPAGWVDARTAWTLAFGAAGLGLNLLPVGLSPGVDFLFGCALGLVPGLAFGAWYGGLGAAVAMLPSLGLWGHPVGLAASVSQGILVSYLVHRRRWQATGAALLFWGVAALPLIALASVTNFFGATLAAQLLVIGKAAINGLINALAAELIVHFRPVQRRLLGRLMPVRPLELYITHLFAPLIAAPLILTMVFTGHSQMQDLVDEEVAESRSMAAGVNRSLSSVVTFYTNYLSALAHEVVASHADATTDSSLGARFATRDLGVTDVLFYPTFGDARVLVRGGAGDGSGTRFTTGSLARRGMPVDARYPLSGRGIANGSLNPTSNQDMPDRSRGSLFIQGTIDGSRYPRSGSSVSLEESPSLGAPAARWSIPVARLPEGGVGGVLVAYVPIRTLFTEAINNARVNGQLVWTHSLGSPVGSDERVVYSSWDGVEPGMTTGDVLESFLSPRVVSNAFMGMRFQVKEDSGVLRGGRYLVVRDEASTLGGTFWLGRDVIDAVYRLHERQAGFILLGLFLLSLPLVVAPLLSRRVARPVTGLADLSVGAAVERQLHDLLPRTGEGIDEVRRLALHLQRTSVDMRRLYTRVRSSREALLKVLVATLEARDKTTGGHSRRVVHYALRLARELDAPSSVMRAVRWGALLHDIGKIAVPDAILQKKGPLTEDEWKLMRSHCELGYAMTAGIKALEPALSVVRYHHERWDGTGYPFRLAKDAIPLAARIFAVADTLDAVTSARPYRPLARTFDQALDELRGNAGTQFDPAVVDAAVKVGAPLWKRLRAEAVAGEVNGLIRLLSDESDFDDDLEAAGGEERSGTGFSNRTGNAFGK